LNRCKARTKAETDLASTGWTSYFKQAFVNKRERNIVRTLKQWQADKAVVDRIKVSFMREEAMKGTNRFRTI